MKTTVIIENLKCDDCKNSVVAALKKFKGITNVDIDITKGSLSFDYRSHNAMEGLRYHLLQIGFPITKDKRVITNIDSNSDYVLYQ